MAYIKNEKICRTVGELIAALSEHPLETQVTCEFSAVRIFRCDPVKGERDFGTYGRIEIEGGEEEDEG